VSSIKGKGFSSFMAQSWHWMLGALGSVVLTIVSILIKLRKCPCCCLNSPTLQLTGKTHLKNGTECGITPMELLTEEIRSTNGHTTYVFNGPVNWSKPFIENTPHFSEESIV
jgi:hypothetical protein